MSHRTKPGEADHQNPCISAASPDEKVTRPVDWETLQAEFSPSPEVAEAVKQVFKDDAEVLRQLS